MTAAVVMPPAVAALDRDKHGRPIPWFVYRDPDTGAPDFRVVGADRMEDAHRFGRCWVCGRNRGRHAAFVIGPMCGVNRVSAEPPSHLDCAVYSARACPFLSTPTMVRREHGLTGVVPAAGVTIPRNPGVALVWSSQTWSRFLVPPRAGAQPGHLWDIGAPSAVRWFAHGRDATRTEVLAAVDSGLPLLLEAAAGDRDPSRAFTELDRQVQAFYPLLPAALPGEVDDRG